MRIFPSVHQPEQTHISGSKKRANEQIVRVASRQTSTYAAAAPRPQTLQQKHSHDVFLKTCRSVLKLSFIWCVARVAAADIAEGKPQMRQNSSSQVEEREASSPAGAVMGSMMGRVVAQTVEEKILLYLAHQLAVGAGP